MSTASNHGIDLCVVDRILHELRKPLASIQAFADLLEEEVSGPLNDEQHDYARTVLHSVEKLDGEMQRLRTLAALVTGEFHMVPRDVRVEDLLDRVEWQHAGCLHRRGIRFYLELPEPGLEVHTDPEALVAALGHVLENCTRFTPEGGEISIGVRCAGQRLQLEITDTGPGIAGAEIERVFDPFHRTGARGGNAGAPTMGIGLSLARGIAEALGGSLRARERTTGGMSFLLELPVVTGKPLVVCGGNGESTEGRD